jgi:hypothetical protein
VASVVKHGGEVSEFVWACIAVLLLLIIGQSYPKFGGWLLIVLVMGMLYRAREAHYLD